MVLNHFQESIVDCKTEQFNNLALEIFKFQAQNNSVYNTFLNHLKINPTNISDIYEIPFLPIEFFKNFKIKTGHFEPEIVFESSSTTKSGVSQHFLKSKKNYETAFIHSFNSVFEQYQNYCHLALLPSYLERNTSSLVYQTNFFINETLHLGSGFYLNNLEDLNQQLIKNEQEQIPTLLWGVTFALLDFAEQFPMPLKYTQIIETGGMKGRRKELIREELHQILKQAFGLNQIMGEYGMTELLSQSYSLNNGVFKAPNWMKVFCRESNDPFGKAIQNRNGRIHIIDLSNIDSCCFIASSDLGKVYENGQFEILGRIDHSDVRGCNLMV